MTTMLKAAPSDWTWMRPRCETCAKTCSRAPSVRGQTALLRR